MTTRLLFREVNERIEGLVRSTRSGLEIRPEQFLCECHDDRCRERLDLTLDEYAEISDRGDVWIVAPGHEADADCLVEERLGYVLVRAR